MQHGRHVNESHYTEAGCAVAQHRWILILALRKSCLMLCFQCMQEALAMQHARAALQVKRRGALAGQVLAQQKASLGPWDSAWDRPEDLELRQGLKLRQGIL